MKLQGTERAPEPAAAVVSVLAEEPRAPKDAAGVSKIHDRVNHHHHAKVNGVRAREKKAIDLDGDSRACINAVKPSLNPQSCQGKGLDSLDNVWAKYPGAEQRQQSVWDVYPRSATATTTTKDVGAARAVASCPASRVFSKLRKVQSVVPVERLPQVSAGRGQLDQVILPRMVRFLKNPAASSTARKSLETFGITEVFFFDFFPPRARPPTQI